MFVFILESLGERVRKGREQPSGGSQCHLLTCYVCHLGQVTFVLGPSLAIQA